MSEKKLYAVKNDKGEWMSLDGTQMEIWHSNNPTLFKDKSYAEAQSMGRKAHVVELVEPEKVVLTKEQAEIVENAHRSGYPATEIFSGTSSGSGEERLLMNAYVNGYEIIDDKKYLVFERLGFKKETLELKPVVQAYHSPFIKNTVLWSIGKRVNLNGMPAAQFTEDEIEHYGLQGYERFEVDTECKNGK